MERKEVAARLATRAPNGASAPVIHQNGAKLAEAAGYLKSARICVLTWVRGNYVDSPHVDHNTDQVRELLAIAQTLEDIRAKLDVKASILGK